MKCRSWDIRIRTSTSAPVVVITRFCVAPRSFGVGGSTDTGPKCPDRGASPPPTSVVHGFRRLADAIWILLATRNSVEDRHAVPRLHISAVATNFDHNQHGLWQSRDSRLFHHGPAHFGIYFDPRSENQPTQTRFCGSRWRVLFQTLWKNPAFCH